MIPIPQQNNLWTQLNVSDVEGDLWASFNIDLTENDGKLRLGKRLILNTNTTDDGSLTNYPVGFVPFYDGGTPKIWTVAGGQVHSSVSLYPSSTFSVDATSGTPASCDSPYSDIIVFNGNLYVTTSLGGGVDKLYKKTAGGNWAANGTDFGSVTGPHMMASYNGRLYITAAGLNYVYSYDGTTIVKSGQYTLQLPTEMTPTFIRASSDRLWIGCINNGGGKGYIYTWDGTTANTPLTQYRLEAIGALSCVIKDDIPYVIDSNGSLLVWNGGTFKKIGGVNRRKNALLYNPTSSTNNRFIHPNGMSVVNGKINALIDGRSYDSSTSLVETIPTGIYEYDESKGFYHKHSFGLSHVVDAITDFGQLKVSAVGGLAEINTPSQSTTRNGTFLAGATYFTDATTTTSGIFYNDSNDTLQKGGYFITKKITADDATLYHLPSVENTWDSFYTIYKKLLNSADKIIVRYRTVEQEPLEISITWLTTTTFTTTTNVLGLEGYEVEVLQGSGSGRTSHITKIDVTSGVYTVTVSETYTGVSGTALARIQNWKFVGVIKQNNQNWNGDTISTPSTWIQFKICMIFTGRNEIERLLLTNANTTPVK